MIARVAVLGLVVVGCAKEATPTTTRTATATVTTSVAPAAPTPATIATPPAKHTDVACVPKSAADRPVAHVAADGNGVVACFLTGDVAEKGNGYPCVRVDVATGAFAAAPSWSKSDPVSAQKPFVVTTTATEVRVCKSGGGDCRSVKAGPQSASVGHGAGGGNDGLIADASPDGTKVFVVAVDDQKHAFGETWDLATGKRDKRVPLSGGKHVLGDVTDVWKVSWVGQRVLVTAHRCCGPAADSELLDPTSGDARALGDPVFFLPVKTRGVVAFEAKEGTRLSIVSTDDASVVKEATLPNHAFDEPELGVASATQLPDGRAAVVYANPPGYAIVDTAAGTIGAPTAIPVCDW